MQKFRVGFVVIAVLAGWFLWPSLARWSLGAPVSRLSFGEYVTEGASAPWVDLSGVFVDETHRVETEMIRGQQDEGWAGSYFPLRAGRNDAAPVKAFLKWRSYSSHEGVAILGRPDESSESLLQRAMTATQDSLQEVHAARLYGHEFPDDLRKALRSCSLPVADDIVLLQQDLEPPSTGGALLRLLAPVGCLALFGATFVRSRRRDGESGPAPRS